MVALYFFEQWVLLTGDVIAVDNGVAGFVGSSFLAVKHLVKDGKVIKGLFRLGKFLFFVAGGLAASTADTTGQIDDFQLPHP